MLKKYVEIVAIEGEQFSFRPEVQIVLFGLLVCLTAWIISDVQLFGHKSMAIFDVWTISHVVTGAVLSYVAIAMRSINLQHPIMLLLVVSLSWEIVEHYIEAAELAALSNWFAGEEILLNRLVADQVAVVSGFYLIKKYPKALLSCMAIGLGILILHIWLGSSMYFFN